MADYKSAYTGAQIDEAITKVRSYETTEGLLKAKTPYIVRINTTGAGGRILFQAPRSGIDPFIDAIDSGASGPTYLRACISGQELLRLKIDTGQTTAINRATSLSQIKITKESTFYSQTTAQGGGAVGHYAMKTTNGAWSLGTLTNSNRLYFVYGTDANYNSSNNLTSIIQFGENGKIYGASFGDYAERRLCYEEVPGLCVAEVGDGSLKRTTERLQRGCHLISDTFGMIIGPEAEHQVPIGVTGRILTHVYEGREEAAKHIGWPVCSGPDGTVSIMTEEEEAKYPSRIIGTISEIPNYEKWGDEEIPVNNRIWIHLK